MKRALRCIYLLFPAFLLLLCACKKEKTDKTNPVIDVSAPGANAIYNMFDTIAVSVKLSDETHLQRIEMVLRYQDGTIAQQGDGMDLSGTSYIWNTTLILSEFRLPTDDYNLEFTVNDGSNVSIKTIPIHIHESPTVKQGFYFVTKNGAQHSYNRTDTNYASLSTIHHNSPFMGSAISNYYQELYAASGVNEDFRSYNIANGLVKWSLNNSSSAPHITACDGDGKNVYLGRSDGKVYKYNADGIIVRTYNSNETSYYVKEIRSCGTYVVVSLYNFATSDKKIAVFDNASGLVKTVIYNQDLKAAFPKSSTELYLVCNNSSGHAVMNVLTLPAGSLYERYDFGNYAAWDACLVDNNTLLVSTAEGKIWYYQNSNTNAIAVSGALQAKRMRYSDKFREVYIASDKNFYVYQVASFALVFKNSITQSDTIADFQAVLNK